jgi:hypothetical protein
MQEPYRKGLANRPGPQSCAGGREVAGEALTGAHAGQPLNSEITTPARRPSPDRGKATPGGPPCEDRAGAAESETLSMRGSLMRENRETSGMPVPCGHGPDGEGRKPHARHVRPRGVGRSRSTDEAGEQSRHAGGGGVRGGKGIDQGEVLSVGHAPDTAPEFAGRSGGQGYGPPLQALAAFDPREEPYEVIPPVRICAGGAGQPASLPRRKRRDKPAWSSGCKSRTRKE